MRLVRKLSRLSFCVSSRKARRLSTTLLRFLSSSMILAWTVLPTYGLQVAHTAQLDERCGQEATQADVDDEAALDDLDDRTLDHAVGFLDLLDGAPCTLVLGTLLRQDQTAFLVLLGEDEGLDRIAQRDDLVRVDVVADAELASRDDALALVADVEQHFVLVDLDDDAVDELAVLDVDHGAGDGIGEGHAEIVGRRSRGGCSCPLRRRCPWHRWLTEEVEVSDKGRSLSDRNTEGPADSGPGRIPAHLPGRGIRRGARSPGIQRSPSWASPCRKRPAPRC